MSLQAQPLYSIEEYLAQERRSEERHEYLDGLVYGIAGESPEHGIVCVNLVGQLHPQLKGTPCQLFSKDTKVRSGPIPRSRYAKKGMFSYPDLLVVCADMQFHDKHRDVLLNPSVIVEVLSPATEAFDRGEKFWRYRTYLSSLKDYLMVSHAMPMIDHYVYRSGEWVLSTITGLESTLHIASIDCSLRLSDVCDRISFPKETPDAKSEPEPAGI